jgi:hypothetical protein
MHRPAAHGSSTKLIPIESRAHATLRYIRSTMEAAASLAVPGSAGMALGAVGLAAFAIASMPSWSDDWLEIWLAAAVVAALVSGLLLARQWRVHGSSLLRAPVRKFATCLLPTLFAGAVLTGVELSNGQLKILPGTWLLLYGCALIAASAAATRLLAALGALFVLLGLAALLAPPASHNALLGAGFGALHLIFGAYLKERGRNASQGR